MCFYSHNLPICKLSLFRYGYFAYYNPERVSQKIHSHHSICISRALRETEKRGYIFFVFL